MTQIPKNHESHCENSELFYLFFQDATTYQRDLLQQMEFQTTLREFEAQQTRRELELQKEAETLHQARVSEALARPHPDKIHPKRLLLSGQGLL